MIELLFKQGFVLGLEVGFALVDVVLAYLVIYFWLMGVENEKRL